MTGQPKTATQRRRQSAVAAIAGADQFERSSDSDTAAGGCDRSDLHSDRCPFRSARVRRGDAPARRRPKRRRPTASSRSKSKPPTSPWYQDAWSTLTAWQTLLIVAALAAIGGLAWYALKPPSADQLYAEIENTIDPANPKSLLEARPPLDKFLERFPDDSRAAGVVPATLKRPKSCAASASWN